MQWRWPVGATQADWIVIGSIAAVTLAAGSLAGFTFSSEYLSPICLSLALFAVAGHLAGQQKAPRTSASLATIAWMFAVAPIVSHAVYLAASAGLPLNDELFARIDQTAGLDVPAIVRATGEVGWLSALSVKAYFQFFLQAVFAYAFLIATRQFERLSDTLSIMTIGMAVTLVSSTLVPAVGTAVHYNLTAADFGHLNGTGATNFHLTHFLGLRDGTMTSFPSPGEWQGLACFPSFHVYHTLTATYALASSRWLVWPSVAVSALIVFTTIPVGGHHVVDLIAGVVAFVVVARLVERKRTARSATRGLLETVLPRARRNRTAAA